MNKEEFYSCVRELVNDRKGQIFTDEFIEPARKMALGRKDIAWENQIYFAAALLIGARGSTELARLLFDMSRG